MARRKQDTVHVPADRVEAEQMLGEYAALEREELTQRLRIQKTIDDAKAVLAAHKREIEAERSSLFAGLKAWWEAGGGAEVSGRNRSADIAGVSIGIRRTPPSVRFARKVTAAKIVELIQSTALSFGDKLIRIATPKLDKSAVIKELLQNPEARAWFDSKGLSVDQTDEFFIDAGLDEAAIEKEISSSE